MADVVAIVVKIPFFYNSFIFLIEFVFIIHIIVPVCTTERTIMSFKLFPTCFGFWEFFSLSLYWPIVVVHTN